MGHADCIVCNKTSPTSMLSVTVLEYQYVLPHDKAYLEIGVAAL